MGGKCGAIVTVCIYKIAEEMLNWGFGQPSGSHFGCVNGRALSQPSVETLKALICCPAE